MLPDLDEGGVPRGVESGLHHGGTDERAPSASVGVMKRHATDGVGTAFLIIGVVFLVIGIPDDPPFVALGIVFLAVGATGVGSRGKTSGDDARHGDGSDGGGPD